MTELPIIFSAPMVRALLDGRKTQTRRLAWLPHDREDSPSLVTRIIDGRRYRASPWQKVRAGDRLWVRENFIKTPAGPAYVADGGDHYGAGGRLKITPCIHMPRVLSRLTLTVTAREDERLQEISEADALAEGVERDIEPCDHARATCQDIGCLGPTHRASFCALWASLHGFESWLADPEVVAISFTTTLENIDARTTP